MSDVSLLDLLGKKKKPKKVKKSKKEDKKSRFGAISSHLLIMLTFLCSTKTADVFSAAAAEDMSTPFAMPKEKTIRFDL